jgi:hypothetical protein
VTTRPRSCGQGCAAFAGGEREEKEEKEELHKEEEALPVLTSTTMMTTTAFDPEGTDVAPPPTMEREDQPGVMALKEEQGG